MVKRKSYDKRQAGDEQGEFHGTVKAERVKTKGDSHGIKSTPSEFFPKKPIEHIYKGNDEIGGFIYPDQPENVIDEQNSNIKMARQADVKKYRK